MSFRPFVGQILRIEILFVLLWNSGFIGAEYGLPYSGPFTFMFWRYLALSGLLGLWLVSSKRWLWPKKKTLYYTTIIGVLAHGVWLTCVLVALDKGVPVGIVALVTALQPLLTGALSGTVLNEPTKAHQWWGLILGFCGVGIAVGARLSQDAIIPAWGYMIPFFSVIGITIASLLQRYWERKSEYKTLANDAALFYQSSATALALFVPAWWVEGFATQWTPPFIGTLAWLVVAVSLGAYWAMWRLLKRQEATRVASLFYLSPPVTMLMAWLAFGDTLIVTDLLGLAVAGVGVLFVYQVGIGALLSKVRRK